MSRERFPKPLPAAAVQALRDEPEHDGWYPFIRDTLVVAQEKLLDRYGGFLHPAAIARNADLPDRVVVTSNIEDKYIAAYGRSGDVGMKKVGQGNRLEGFSDRKAGVIYLSDPNKAWESLPDTKKKKLRTKKGDAEAKDMYVHNRLRRNAVHEKTHQYHDQSTPDILQELTTRFIELDVLDEMGYRHDREDVDKHEYTLNVAMQSLLANFGESVFAMALGTLEDAYMRREIKRAAYGIELVLAEQRIVW